MCNPRLQILKAKSAASRKSSLFCMTGAAFWLRIQAVAAALWPAAKTECRGIQRACMRRLGISASTSTSKFLGKSWQHSAARIASSSVCLKFRTSSAAGLVKSIVALDVGYPSYFSWRDVLYYFVRYQAWLIAAYLICRLTTRTPLAAFGRSVGDRMARSLARYIDRDDGERITAKAVCSAQCQSSCHTLESLLSGDARMPTRDACRLVIPTSTSSQTLAVDLPLHFKKAWRCVECALHWCL